MTLLCSILLIPCHPRVITESRIWLLSQDEQSRVLPCDCSPLRASLRSASPCFPLKHTKPAKKPPKHPDRGARTRTQQGLGVLLVGPILSPSKRRGSAITCTAVGVCPDAPSVGRALNSLTREQWSLSPPRRGVPPGDLQAQGTVPSLEDAVLDEGTLGRGGHSQDGALSPRDGSRDLPIWIRSPPAAPRAPWDGGTVPAQPGQAALGGAVVLPAHCGGAGPAPVAPSLFLLPRAPSPLASLCCLFLAASEPRLPPLQAHPGRSSAPSPQPWQRERMRLPSGAAARRFAGVTRASSWQSCILLSPAPAKGYCS